MLFSLCTVSYLLKICLIAAKKNIIAYCFRYICICIQYYLYLSVCTVHWLVAAIHLLKRGYTLPQPCPFLDNDNIGHID